MDIIHAFEQAQAFLKDMPPLLMNYKKELKKQGFTDEEAFTLVRDYQKTLFTHANKN